jgi:hypothetical protein
VRVGCRGNTGAIDADIAGEQLGTCGSADRYTSGPEQKQNSLATSFGLAGTRIDINGVLSLVLPFAQETCATPIRRFTMLVRLFGRNFRSLRDPFELSMVAADLTRSEDAERGVIPVTLDGISEPLRLLRVIALFGHNASGKSTVLTAARAINWLVRNSSATGKPGSKIAPYEPFRLDKGSDRAPVRLGCDVVHDRAILRYEIAYGSRQIEEEKLSLLTGDAERTLIDRKPTGEVIGELITRSAANQLYVKGMQPNVAVLSKLAQHGPARGEDSVQPYYRSIIKATRYEDYSHSAVLTQSLGDSARDRFADDAAYRKWIMQNLIATADVGIRDVEVRRETIEVPDTVRQFALTQDGFKLPDKHVVVSFVHDGANRKALEFALESSGTKKLFNIADDWWRLAHESVTLFADELSASLHPRLLDGLIRAVNAAPSSDLRSQIVFATHSVDLLEGHDGQPPALRRDQVYFTKKDCNGASDLYSLAEFKDDARPVHNLRKRYLSGLYGAIPSVERLSL